MTLLYFKGQWPEDEDMGGAGLLFYEIDEDRDVALRMVGHFPDGMERNSVELESRNGWPCTSLARRQILRLARGFLEPISPDEFESVWTAAPDKPAPKAH